MNTRLRNISFDTALTKIAGLAVQRQRKFATPGDAATAPTAAVGAAGGLATTGAANTGSAPTITGSIANWWNALSPMQRRLIIGTGVGTGLGAISAAMQEKKRRDWLWQLLSGAALGAAGGGAWHALSAGADIEDSPKVQRARRAQRLIEHSFEGEHDTDPNSTKPGKSKKSRESFGLTSGAGGYPINQVMALANIEAAPSQLLAGAKVILANTSDSRLRHALKSTIDILQQRVAQDTRQMAADPEYKINPGTIQDFGVPESVSKFLQSYQPPDPENVGILGQLQEAYRGSTDGRGPVDRLGLPTRGSAWDVIKALPPISTARFISSGDMNLSQAIGPAIGAATTLAAGRYSSPTELLLLKRMLPGGLTRMTSKLIQPGIKQFHVGGLRGQNLTGEEFVKHLFGEGIGSEVFKKLPQLNLELDAYARNQPLRFNPFTRYRQRRNPGVFVDENWRVQDRPVKPDIALLQDATTQRAKFTNRNLRRLLGEAHYAYRQRKFPSRLARAGLKTIGGGFLGAVGQSFLNRILTGENPYAEAYRARYYSGR